jgi:hypothetical protein
MRQYPGEWKELLPVTKTGDSPEINELIEQLERDLQDTQRASKER